MKTFIVFGCGRFGSTVATRLYDLKNDVVIVDYDEEKIDAISENVTEAVICDLEDEKAMTELALKNYDVAVIAIGENLEAAVMAVLASKEAGIEKVIAKAPNYRFGKILLKCGADKIIFPERDMGFRLANNLSNDYLLDANEISKGYTIYDLKASPKMNGKEIRDLKLREDYNFNVLMVKRAGENFVNPLASFKIKEEDILTVLGSDKDIKRFTEVN
ncbi:MULTISPECIES: potassium channel family protein [Peptoniphilus]|uniref:TrkA family potassium uptake protein n=2 Tax=Peptoniphilus TaxID=162289 RepID=A0ABU7XBW9_9FIRM|nr:TrkA family potassium uptake protein [Peptoniphilus grossensis]MDU5098984.1 TrkA family potassium uptake protein [Peptoniphilus grossensis]